MNIDNDKQDTGYERIAYTDGTNGKGCSQENRKRNETRDNGFGDDAGHCVGIGGL